jgi:uncharacterized protein
VTRAARTVVSEAVDASALTPAVSRSVRVGVSITLVVVAVTVVLRTQDQLVPERMRVWSTLFVAMSIQAFPFLVLGVVVSAALAAFAPPDLLHRMLPRRAAVAVPAAGLYGMALPGCECGSVPVAGRLVAAGTPPASAVTFLLAAPAINPVVLVSTSVAFPGRSDVVLARFVASLCAAIAVGWWWTRSSNTKATSTSLVLPGDDVPRRHVFGDTLLHDLSMAGGYLVLGAALAATIQVVVPRGAIDRIAGNEVLAIAVLAALAIILSVCSEADAFVAAGLPQFSLTSRLVFMVVGPMLDLKLIAMQHGVFGPQFVRRFAPATLVAALVSAVLVGMIVL